MKTYPVLQQAPCREDVWGSGSIAPRILISALDGGEWWASHHGRFTPGKKPRHPFDNRLGGPQSRSGSGDEEKSLPLRDRFGQNSVWQTCTKFVQPFWFWFSPAHCKDKFTSVSAWNFTYNVQILWQILLKLEKQHFYYRYTSNKMCSIHFS
jgi:hypothetical protein